MIFQTTYKKDEKTLLNQLDEIKKYLYIINEASGKYHIQPCIICGIGSRESAWGLTLKPPGPSGTGDFAKRAPNLHREGPLPSDGLGFGRGLLQIDYDWHPLARDTEKRWADPWENLMYGCRLLANNVKGFAGEFQEDGHQILKAALAAYNAGVGRIKAAIINGVDADSLTTGGDYGKDVISRAGWFQVMGGYE